MTRRTHPPQTKTRALELWAEHGPHTAARILASEGHNVPPNTIASWARRNGLQSRCVENRAARVQASMLAWTERRLDLANKAGGYAEDFADAMAAAVQRGDADMVKALVPAFGVMVDKAQLLTGGVTGRDEQVRTSAGHLRAVTEARVRELRDALPAPSVVA